MSVHPDGLGVFQLFWPLQLTVTQMCCEGGDMWPHPLHQGVSQVPICQRSTPEINQYKHCAMQCHQVHYACVCVRACVCVARARACVCVSVCVSIDQRVMTQLTHTSPVGVGLSLDSFPSSHPVGIQARMPMQEPSHQWRTRPHSHRSSLRMRSLHKEAVVQ